MKTLQKKLEELPIFTVDNDHIYNLQIERDWFNMRRIWFVRYICKTGGFYQQQNEDLEKAVDAMIKEIGKRLTKKIHCGKTEL